MKTIKLTLAMVALLIGATAFASYGDTDPVKTGTKETTYYYRNNGSGNYSQIPASEANPSLHCGEETDANWCIVQSATDVQSFNVSSAPTDVAPVTGSNKAIYE